MMQNILESTYKCDICKNKFKTKGTPLFYQTRDDIIYFCTFKHRGYHYNKIGDKEMFLMDLKHHYQYISESQYKALLVRIHDYKKYFNDYTHGFRTWLIILERVETFFEINESNKEKSLLQRTFLGHSFEVLEFLRKIKRERRLNKRYEEEYCMLDIKYDKNWEKLEEKFPMIYSFENITAMGYFLRYLEIKLKKEFQADVPFKLIIESISTLKSI